MSRRLVLPALALALTLPSVASGQDADADGVPDGSDALPCDASASAVAHAPAEGAFGLVLFEDRWPSAGDLDFNDVVLAYNYVLRLNGAGQVVSLRATIDVLALGGTLSLGGGLQLPVPRASVASVSRSINGGAMQSLDASTADDALTIRFSPDLRELFGNASGPINSASDVPRQPAQRVELEIVLATPAAISPSAAPFDLFVFLAADPSHEIHRPEFGGTAAMNRSLFGTADDRSAGGRSFVEAGGIPFALLLPELATYPAERTAITLLFPSMIQWAASGGAQSADFYSSGVDASRAYVSSDGQGPASPGAIAPAASRACLAGAVFSFVDGAGNDVGPTALRDALLARGASASEFIYFSVSGPGGNHGAWCSERADWYVSNYVNLSPAGTSLSSGGWNKWHRSVSGSWVGPVTTGQTNYFGSPCDGQPYSWCSEWGLGGRYLGVMPNQSGGETYAGSWSGGAGWQFELRIGASAEATCGFSTAAPTCSDGVWNQSEAGVDCGGPCAPCPSCDDGIRNQDETGVDCGGTCNACPTCTDGVRNQDEERIDCGGVCGACPESTAGVFTFVDTAADNVSSRALWDFMNGLVVQSSDFIYFSVNAGGSGGAWCGERADWYVSNYLSLSPAGTSLPSGGWNKWHRPTGGAWSAPVTTGYTNYFGTPCDSQTYSWCSEWGLGGRYLGVMPAQPSSGESYSGGWSNGAGWTVEIRVGPSRSDACSF